MELNLTLKDRKFIKNTKTMDLPKFVDGAMPIGGTSNPYGYNPSQTYTGSTSTVLSTPSNIRTPMTQNVAPQESGVITKDGITAPKQDFNGLVRMPSDSAAAGAGPWFAIGAWLGGGVLEGLNSKKSADQLIADAGTGSSSIGGISYLTYNDVDAGKIMSEYDRSTATDFLTNPARGLTKMFSRGSQKEEARRAQELAYRTNLFNKDSALSEHLNQLQGLKYGDTRSQTLFAAKDGKPVYSAYGKTNAPATAKVSSGETLVEPDGSSYVIPGDPNFKDGKLANVGNETAILSNHGASLYYQLTGDLDGALELDKQHRYSKGIKYKCGKLPRFKEGWWGGFVPNALSGIASIGQMILAGSQIPYRTNTYEPNRLANRALNTLAGLRVNPYNIYPTIWDAYGRATSSIDRSGGLSSGLRAAAKIAAMSQTQGNIANMLTQHQTQNNAYKANWAQQALSAGAHDASNRMAANQFDENYFAKSHAARQQGLQMGLYNLINSVQNYYANDFKRRQFNDTMDLYRSQNLLDWNKYYKSLG